MQIEKQRKQIMPGTFRSSFGKFFMLALLLGALGAISAAETPSNDEWFPILAWGPTNWYNPEGRELTQRDFDLMKECGFNIAGFAPFKHLDMIARAGLKTYYWDTPLADAKGLDGNDFAAYPKLVANAVAKVRGRPEVIGFFLRDEPVARSFRGLGALSAEIRRQAPHLVPYINLYPNTVSSKHLGCSYDEYLKQYTETCNMPFLSYDFYSLPTDRYAPISDRYWLNLEQARNAAERAGIKFHYCTLGVTHFRHRQPTLDDLHFEIYSALLYGAKGLAIFTYFTPPIGNFREAAISEFGERTQVWYDLKKVLKSVNNRAALLNNLRSIAVYHIPHVSRELGTRGPDERSLLVGVSDDSDARFAVGEFVHQGTGQVYIMILNKDLNVSHSINLKWRNGAPAKVEINPASRKNEWHLLTGEECWIAPGHAHLLRVSGLNGDADRGRPMSKKDSGVSGNRLSFRDIVAWLTK